MKLRPALFFLTIAGCGIPPGRAFLPSGEITEFVPTVCLWSPRAHYNFGQDSGAVSSTWLVLGPRRGADSTGNWVGWIAPLAPYEDGWAFAGAAPVRDGDWKVWWADLLGSQDFVFDLVGDTAFGRGTWITDISARDSAGTVGQGEIPLEELRAIKRPCSEAPRRRKIS